MKKTAAVAAVALLVLTGCGKSGKSEEQKACEQAGYTWVHDAMVLGVHASSRPRPLSKPGSTPKSKASAGVVTKHNPKPKAKKKHHDTDEWECQDQQGNEIELDD